VSKNDEESKRKKAKEMKKRKKDKNKCIIKHELYDKLRFGDV
jgi:hypothetical protein